MPMTRRQRWSGWLGSGASRVDWKRKPADADFVILADPEGNRFCVIDKG